jgi:hypothetical protein
MQFVRETFFRETRLLVNGPGLRLRRYHAIARCFELVSPSPEWSGIHSVTASDSEAVNFGRMAIRGEFLERMIVDLRRRGIAREAGGIEPAYFAYPFGQDTEVGALAPAVTEEASFTAAFTTHARVLRSRDLQHPFRLPELKPKVGDGMKG